MEPFGPGLETASEGTLLTLAASTASGGAGGAGLLAALTLPLLVAAGMSAFDTADGGRPRSPLPVLVVVWRGAALLWRLGGFEHRHGRAVPGTASTISSPDGPASAT